MARLPTRIFRGLSRHPLAVTTAASLGLRFGKDVVRLRRGDIDAQEFRGRAGQHVGAVSGNLAGAMAGAAAGTAALPGLGTVLGGFAGGVLGENVGGKLGRRTIEHIARHYTARPKSP